jgi:uncharacterized membrane protein
MLATKINKKTTRLSFVSVVLVVKADAIGEMSLIWLSLTLQGHSKCEKHAHTKKRMKQTTRPRFVSVAFVAKVAASGEMSLIRL